ncbi:MAG: hypothetical protein Q4G59_11025, partial [Planctomycetia bacterium]|nr:hypothetical protein [Planctomycetia bacterium]
APAPVQEKTADIKAQPEKTASTPETRNITVKKTVVPVAPVTQKRPEVKVASDAPATASSNATFLNSSSLKKQKESKVVEAPKKPEVAPQTPKAPQEKERIQESNNGFRPRPVNNTETLPAGEFHVLRPTSLLPQRIPAVAAPRSSLSIAEENGVGSNF